MSVTPLKKDEIVKEREIDGSAPAVVIKMAKQINQSLMEMSFAIPLDMTPKDLNAYVDKVSGVMDRQSDKADLEAQEMALQAAERDLFTNLDQLSNQRARDETDWSIGQKRGDFRPTESQKKQYENWEKTSRGLREDRIPKFKANIEALKKKIYGED